MSFRLSAIVKDILVDTQVETKFHTDTFIDSMRRLVGERINLESSYGDLEWFDSEYPNLSYSFHKSWLEDFDAPIEE